MSNIGQIEGMPEVGLPPAVPTASPPAATTRATGEQCFLMRGIDWATYRKLSDALNGRHFHLAYDRGNLELMTISSTHANCGRLIAQLVAVLSEECDIPRKSCGDMTCDRQELERGVEPDECFYLTNEPLIRNKEPINLRNDPPPDLVVEVDICRSSIHRLGIYAALGVPEIWRCDGENVFIHQRGADGQYAVAERSGYFAFVTGSELARFLRQRTQMDENSLVRSFRSWVREQLAGRA